MRSMLACLVAAFVAMLLIGAPAIATDACNGGPAACRIQADAPFKLAAEMPAQPRMSRKGTASPKCTGKFGVALQRCKCEAKGEPGFPCHFVPAHPPVPASCACR